MPLSRFIHNSQESGENTTVMHDPVFSSNSQPSIALLDSNYFAAGVVSVEWISGTTYRERRNCFVPKMGGS